LHGPAYCIDAALQASCAKPSEGVLLHKCGLTAVAAAAAVLSLLLLLRRDVASHGTHVAATAAGNYGVPFRNGILSGMAPRARIAAYKV
jgi:subtilisin family serine protease